MATADEEYYLRSSLLLLKAGTYIAKKTLIREEQKEKQKSGRDLDDLLNENKTKLEHEFRNHKQREKLYPSGRKTNVEDWDISLLTGVLQTVFRSSLSKTEMQAVRSIKHLRNDVYAHRTTAGLSLDNYTDICDDLKATFRTLAFGFGPEVKNECSCLEASCLLGPLDIKSHIEHLKRVSDTDDMFRDVLEKIDATGKQITHDVKDALKLEHMCLKKDITSDISNSKTEICKVIKETQLQKSELSTLVKEALHQALQEKRHTRKVKVVESEVELSGKEEDQPNIDLAEQIITTVTNEAIRRKETSEEFVDIREAIREFLDGITSKTEAKALEAGMGSVIIRFDCCTYEQLFRFLDYLESDEMKQRLNKLALVLSRHLSMKHLLLSASLSLKTLQNVMDELGTATEDTHMQTDIYAEEMNLEMPHGTPKAGTATEDTQMQTDIYAEEMNLEIPHGTPKADVLDKEEAEEIPRDDVLKFNIEAYLPYICECVKAKHLLIQLDYFTKEQRTEIIKMCGRNNVAATQRALAILMHEKDDPGRFSAIRDAIEDSGYPKIAQMLDGNIGPYDANCQKIVESFAYEIIKRLNPVKLLPKLVSQGTITADDAEDVRAEERNHGKRRACWVLLFHLPNRAENWFRNVFNALLGHDYSDIAELLDPDLFNKIMKPRKAASSAYSVPGIDETRENILTDNNFDSTLEKEDIEQPEKSVVESTHDNYDKNLKDFENISKKFGLDSLMKDTDDLKMRNKEGDDVCDRLTYDKCLTESHAKRRSESDINFDNEELVEGKMVAMAFPEQLNELGIGMGLYVSDETEFNIATDADKVGAEDEDIPLREYQKELAKEGSKGNNVIVMAPTNTGKTRVACRIMQVHLRGHRQSGKIGKVIFLVENEALAFQRGGVCAELLPAYRTKVISGSIQRDKKQYLRDFVNKRDILVVTAQVLLNALQTKEIHSITAFSMVVFDECHHTYNNHRFNQIMNQYMDLKLRKNLDAEHLPQIVGLTASIGVGGNTKHDLAMIHIKGLLANLDAKFLCTVRKNKEELRYYKNNTMKDHYGV